MGEQLPEHWAEKYHAATRAYMQVYFPSDRLLTKRDKRQLSRCARRIRSILREIQFL